jgi:molecular chaperone HscB
MSHPDHFALFAMPARFALDEAELERAHKDVQSKVHPDRFASGSAAERRVAMQWAARANEAYRTLKSPLSRAAFLCERAGVPIDANVNTSMPVEFLAQQMEWREALDDARADGDASRFSALTGEIDEVHGRLIAELASALDVRGDYAGAAGLVRRLMFVDKFRDELRSAIEAQIAPKASA